MASRFRWKRLLRRAWPVLLPSLLGLAGAAGAVNVRAQGDGPVQVAQLPEGGKDGQWKHPESGATSPSGSGAVGPGERQGAPRDATPPSPPPMTPPPKPDTRRPSDPPPRNPGPAQPLPPIPAPQVPNKTDYRQ